MRFNILLIWLFFILLSSPIKAQSDMIDSLKKEVSQSRGGEKVRLLNELSRAYWDYSADSSLKFAQEALSVANKINDDAGVSDALNRIGNAYFFKDEPEKAISYYKSCLEIREKLNDYKRLIQIYNNFGVFYSISGNFDKAKDYYLKALNISKENNDQPEMLNYYFSLADLAERGNNYDQAIEYYYHAEELAREIDSKVDLGVIYNNRGYIYQNISSYDKALKAHLKALDYFKSANDESGMASSYNFIGMVNQSLKNYDKALEYYTRMMDIYEKNNQRSNLAIAYNNIGIIYDDKGDNEKALEYYQKAYELNKEFNFDKGMSTALNNIGLIYFELEAYEKALDYLQQSLKISTELNDKLARANTNNNMAEVLIEMGEYKEAERKIDKGLKLSKEAKSKEYTDESYRLYSLLFEAVGDHEKALHYHKLHNRLNDTIFSREKQNRIAEIQIKYETEKKEKEIELLKRAHELQYKRQQTITISSLIVTAMLLIVIGLVYNQFRLKKKNTKILEEKNAQLRTANKKLKESEKNLRELNATKDKFFSIISHDLKNPFQALFGFAEVMYHNINDFKTSEIKEYSKAIYESSQNLYNLLENLLQWSRSQLGSITLKPQLLDIHSSIDDIISLLAINAEEKQITISNDVPENTEAFVDENVFSTVMRNLLNNSIKFTNLGGKVHISAENKDNQITISVADTGQGISTENIKKLFRIDTSHSTKGTANEPGTGLGLILCKELIEKSNGKIWVDSDEGNGSIFRFTLPKKPDNT